MVNEKNIVLNIDFDYFFEFTNNPKIVTDYFTLIKKYFDKIKLTTITLSPSQNTWKESEEILKIFNDIFKLKLEIP